MGEPILEVRCCRIGGTLVNVIIVGGGIGGLHARAVPAPRGHPLRVLRAVRRNSVRSASASTSCRTPRASSRRLGLEAELVARLGADARGRVLQPLRAADLPRSRSAATRATTIRSTRFIAASCTSAARRGGRAPRRRPRASPDGSASASSRTRRRRRRSFAIDDPRGACARSAPTSLVGCDGLHSVVRKALHPDEGPPLYSGVNMWRGVTRLAADPDGREHDPRGLARDRQDGDLPDPRQRRRQGRQLVNWVAELETPQHTDSATGLAPASSTISSARSRTGTSIGSTCRR